MATKMSRRELQGPDRFQQEAGGVFDWAQNHPKEVAMGGAGLLVVILAIGLIFGGGGSDRVDNAAGEDFAAALALVDRPVGGTAAEGQEAPFATEREKQEAVAAAMEKVRSEHGGTSTAVAAALPLADARYKLGQYEDALGLYDEYLKKAPRDAQLRFLALEGRAQTLEAMGNTDQALQAWDRLASDAPAYADRALYGKGRLLEEQGRTDEARQAYETIRSEHGQGAMARLAAERLAVLETQQPKAAGSATGE